MDLIQNIIPYMNRADHELDIPLTPQQEISAKALTVEDLAEINNFLMTCLTKQAQKTAKIASKAITHFQSIYPYLPDVFYSGRLKLLQTQGKLLAEGNLDRMRFSEVRLLP